MEAAEQAGQGHFDDQGMSAAQLDVHASIGKARLGGYPHGRVLIGAGGAGLPGRGAWPCGASVAASSGVAHEAAGVHGGLVDVDAGMVSASMETSEVPFLALEMNSVLLYVLYSLPASEVEEYGPVLVRLIYLALFVQMCMDYHAHLMAAADASAAAGGVAMDTDSPLDASSLNLEALILSEMRQLDLPLALAHSSRLVSASGAAAAHGVAAARAEAKELGSLESYVYRCSLPFLRRCRLLLCVHSGDTTLAPPVPTAGAAALGSAASLESEWRAAMAALRLPMTEGSVIPAVGEYSRELVRGWMRELEPARRDCSCWPLVWQAFPRPQDLGFPLLIPLPDLYHDLYMTYRYAMGSPHVYV
jgi:hypothetical protein